MPDDIRAKLLHEAQRLRRREKLSSMLGSLLPDYWALCKKRKQLESDLRKEESDCEEIETLGLANIVCRILGNLEQRVEKERQEAAAALLKLNQCDEESEKTQARIDEAENERKTLDDVPEKYKALSEEKKRLLLREGNPAFRQLIAMDMDLERLNDRLRGIDEARDAGRSALYALDSTGRMFKSAKNLGLWDIFGGGLFVARRKHERIDEANDSAKIAHDRLERFKTKLADVEIAQDITPDVGIVWKSVDFCPGGIFADLAVQSKITDARKNIDRTVRQVKDALEQLDVLKTTEEQAMQKLAEEYRRVLEES